MNSFENLLHRVGILVEAKTSPFAGTHPSFGGITKSMSTRGMSSAPYDTVKFLATFLYELDIISDDERKMVLKAQGFKGKQLALLEVIKAKSQEIVANSARIEEAMPTELENYINRATLNRGRDMMADVKGIEGGSGGRRDKYAAQAAALAAKRKASAEAKMQSKALQAAAQGEDTDVQSAVDVLVNTLDDADREVVDRADVAAGIGFKGAADVKLDFDDIDINIGAPVKDRDTLIDKLVKFFNKQPNYTAEKTRRGVNVEGPAGSFGTNVQDAEDMIISLIKRARPDIDETQIVVDLFSDKGVTEDEEGYGEEDYEDEDDPEEGNYAYDDENYDPEEEALERRRRAREGGDYRNYRPGEEPSYPWDDEDGDDDEAAICSVCERPMSDDEIGDELPEERVCDQCAGIEDEEGEGEYGAAMGDTVEGEAETVFYGDDGEEVDGVVSYIATKNPRTGEIDIELTGGYVTGNNPAARVDDDYIDSIISNPRYNQDHIADAYQDAEYQFSRMGGAKEEDGEDKPDYLDFDKDGDKKEPMKQALKTESYTNMYIAEQARKDSYSKKSGEVGLTFKERYKPKTSYQLDELRRYGL